MTNAISQKVVLAIDIGSSSIRAMVFDMRARAVDELVSQKPYELITTPDGGVTLDPLALLPLVESCIDDVVSRLGGDFHVAAVGMSSFWHSLIGLDPEGQPTTPMLHLADSRSAEIVDRLRSQMDQEAMRAISGTVFHSSYWPAKLRWLAEADPLAYRSTTTWTSGPDFVYGRLTGTRTTSVCMASGTGMLDVSECDWSPDLARVAEIELATLPPLVDGEQVDRLAAEYGERWPALKDAHWFAPLGDGACANIGSNAYGPGRIALTLGTTGAMRVLLESSAGIQIKPATGVWTYRLDRRSVLRGAAITNGGIVTDFLRELLGEVEHDLLDDAVALPTAEHGLTMLPFLAGERAPLWNDRARAVVAGLHPGTTPAELMRAGMEAVAHRLRLLYELVAPLADGEHVIVANGAALLKSPGWQEIVASDLEHALTTLAEGLEASARGAAMYAMLHSGLISSFDDVDDLVSGAAVVMPDREDAARLRNERSRQELLQNLLYPGTESWDQEIAPGC